MVSLQEFLLNYKNINSIIEYHKNLFSAIVFLIENDERNESTIKGISKL